MKCVCCFTILLIIFSGVLPAYAEPLDLTDDINEPIGKALSFFLESDSSLDIDEALKMYTEGKFTDSDSGSLNFGIGSNPAWLSFEADNPEKTDILRRLSIETSWLDYIDVYFISQTIIPSRQTTVEFHGGDSQRFSERKINSRFFQFDHAFKPGRTRVFIRIQTPDPLVLPVYLNSVATTYSRQLLDSYSYGFLYGGLFVLMAYNLMLFLSLKNYKYLLYSFFLMSFLIANFAYTGHAYKYLWTDSPHWQMWSNPLLMIMYSIAGLMFAIRFLNMKNYFPKIHYSVIYACVMVFILQLFSIATSNHLLSLLIAFSFMVVFSIAMPVLGIISVCAKNKSAKYFLIASVIHTTAAGITAMVVWSFIPYSVAGYRAVDMGMMIDAVLLAMALAHQFRTVRDEKLLAEKLALVDPLTQINNRRAFQKFVNPMWSNTLRSHQIVSIIIIDIDRFKLINDTYGHAQGDEVLIEVAGTLKKVIRNGDILARWGGEEFIIYLPDTKNSEAVTLANRFCKSIANLQITTASNTISITVSIGVADNASNAESLDKLISDADKNLYLAKDQGRNRVVSGALL